jgi:hypothetical protein
MKASVCIAVILGMMVSMAAADWGRMSAGGYVGTGFSNGGDALEGFQYTEFRPGVAVGGNLLYRHPSGHSIELGGQSLTIEMRELGEKIGSLQLTPLMASYSFQWIPRFGSGSTDSAGTMTQPATTTGFTWHVDLGLGISLTDFKKGPLLEAIEDTFDFNILIETENPLVVRIGGGAGLFLSKNIAATLDVQVVLCDVGTTWEVEEEGVTSPVEEIETFAAGTTQFGLGLRFWY